MAGMTKLRKHQFIPFVDVSKTVGTSAWTPEWKRITYSTIFDLAANPETTSEDYIAYEVPVEEISKYAPELPQEVALYEGDPTYDFMFELFFNLPVGSETRLPVLMCFGGSGKKAWQVKETVVVLGSLNTVDGKLSFTLKLGGTIQRGTYEIAEGVPTFSETTAAAAE